VLFLAVLLLVCAATACAGGAPALVGEVVVSTPHESAPLSRLLAFDTDRPAVALVSVSGGDREWTVSTGETPQTSHELPIVGLRADTEYTLSVALRDESASASTPISTTGFATAPLPAEDFPPLRINVSDPQRMEPGMTLFSVIRWIPNAEDLENGWLIIVDEEGEVVWYHRAPHRIVDVRRTARGTILYQYNHGIVEIDMLGNEISHWYASGLWDAPPNDPVLTVETDVFHHQAIELPSGDILTLGTEAREYDNYPTSISDPDAPRETTHLIGDVAVQFRRDGSIVREWKLLDVLDPYRLSYDSLGGFWNREGYGFIESGTRDWSHGNGVIPDPRDDGIIVTLRHQDAAVKIDRDGGLVWILGDPAGWSETFQPYLLQPVGELEWPYHLHGPQITPDGNLMLFDNGNFRALPPAEPVPHAENYSRAVEYAIDEDAMTVRQVWAYGGPGSEMFYTPFLGDADRLPITGNVLITDGGRLVNADGVPTNNVVAARKWARLLEVTGGESPETVFELIIDHGEDVSEIAGWSVFQADRIPSLR
jgi:hypothetical protein